MKRSRLIKEAAVSTSLVLAIALLIISLGPLYAEWPLEITVTTNKQEYGVNEDVTISGTLVFNGIPVNGTLVGLEVRDRADLPFVFRTLPCGTITQTNWLVDITAIYPCNSNGVPKYSFKKNEKVFFFCTVTNFDLYADHHILLCISLYDAFAVPIRAACLLAQDLTRDSSATTLSMLIEVESGMVSGTYTVYASVFDDYPGSEGIPYCPEKTTSFTVSTSSTYASQFSSLQVGTYQTSYHIPSQQARLGNFTVYASAHYTGKTSATNAIFEVVLKGDITNDMIVNFLDAIRLGSAYGTRPGDHDWNPNADLNHDDIINYLDSIILGSNYGSTGW
jgi:hypothetical protein